MERRENFLKKIEAGTQKEPRVGNLVLNLEKQEMVNTKTGESLHLTPTEYKVLWTLVRADGAFVTSDELFTFIYEETPDDKDLPLSNTVSQYIFKIKDKIRKLMSETIILESEIRFGYKLHVKE